MPWHVRWNLGLFVAAIACGPAVDDPSATGESSTGSSSSDTAQSTEESSGTPTSEGSEDSGSPLSCESFHDEAAEGAPVEIQIRNVGTETLLLDAPCFNTDYLSLQTASGWRWPGGSCTGTCQTVFADGCFVCDGCASALYTVLPPGSTLSVTWNGILYADVAAPTECFPYGACNDTCPQKRLPRAEAVIASIVAISHADCIALEPDPSVCDCADPSGEPCENFGTTYIAPTVSGMAVWEPGASGPMVIELSG